MGKDSRRLAGVDSSTGTENGEGDDRDRFGTKESMSFARARLGDQRRLRPVYLRVGM
jgi:hypothetical protein